MTTICGAFTYVSPLQPMVEEMQITNSLTAIEGDIVEACDGVVTKIVRRHNEKIAGVIVINSTKKYGYTKRGVCLYKFIPFSWKYPNFIVASSTRSKVNLYAVIQFSSWLKDKLYPSGSCINILGIIDDSLALDLAIMHKNQLYCKGYSKKVFLHPGDESKREPFITDDIISIDPVGSIDKDDAYHIDDNYIYVHISDVDSIFTRELDEELQRRLFTIYGICNIYHMLPDYLISKVTLNNDGVKPAITVILDKNLEGVRYCLSNIKVRRCLTYEQAMDEINDSDSPVHRLSQILGCTDTHILIEKIMIATNKYIGALISDRPCLYRVMEERYAMYSTDAGFHAGLDIDNYVHFTSPMRRYSDLIIARILKGVAYSKCDLDNIAMLLNNYQTKLKRYYRDQKIIKLCMTIKDTCFLQGTVIDYNSNYISIYIPIHDLEYKYHIIHPSLHDMFKIIFNETTLTITYREKSVTFIKNDMIDIVLIVNPKAISLRERLILRVVKISDLLNSL